MNSVVVQIIYTYRYRSPDRLSVAILTEQWLSFGPTEPCLSQLLPLPWVLLRQPKEAERDKEEVRKKGPGEKWKP